VTPLRVLAVDDDPQILRALRAGLQAAGFEPTTAPNGETALDILSRQNIDVVVLDLGLPGIGGQEVIRRLRSWSDVPVVVLSVHEDQRDKVEALDAGADDYVTKPFAMEELLARIRAVQRRSKAEKVPPLLRFGDLEVDLARHLVTVGGERVHLTATEYSLLEAFATQPGKLLTHGWLIRQVWGQGYADDSRGLRVFVRQLRRKLGDDATNPRWVLTEAGLGYRWLPSPDREG
jgi:two-component system, OmpR family, KDP operon response regulator KdpE